MERIRVLVVEDSLTIRKRLVEVLESDPGLEVVAEAADGAQAIETCRRVRPDVITLDMILPVMSGLAVTEYIMAYCPTPILVVSASVNRGELFKTYEALAAGAVDVLDKPTGSEPDLDWEKRLLATVKLVSRIKVITHLRGRDARPRWSVPGLQRFAPGAAPRLLAIGASIGGPAAVASILQALPARFPLPILLVIHIGASFGETFAEWLDGQSALQVRSAVDGEPLPPAGTSGVLMAPPERHLVLRRGKLWLTHDAERYSCRPSVDVLFESVAREAGSSAVGCLLTGMGKDGANGLLEMRQAGALTITQDEATSVVFGMPGEAVRIGAAGQVLPLWQIGRTLAELPAYRAEVEP